MWSSTDVRCCCVSLKFKVLTSSPVHSLQHPPWPRRSFTHWFQNQWLHHFDPKYSRRCTAQCHGPSLCSLWMLGLVHTCLDKCSQYSSDSYLGNNEELQNVFSYSWQPVFIPVKLNSWWWLFIPSVMFDSLQPHGLQHARIPCPSPSPRVC